jgi:hypothetical protein
MDVITAVSLCGPVEKSQELAPGSKLTVTVLRLVKETKESPRAVGKRLAGITTWDQAWPLVIARIKTKSRIL